MTQSAWWRCAHNATRRIAAVVMACAVFLSSAILAAPREEPKIAVGSASSVEYGAAFAQFTQQFSAQRKAKQSLYAVYARYVPDVGVAAILRYLEADDAACHGVAHELGRVTAEHEPVLAHAMAVCGDGCTYGCVHGVFKTYFMKGRAEQGQAHHHEHGVGTTMPEMMTSIRAEITTVCAGDSTIVADFFRGNCAHSVGHAFGGLSEDVATAVKECRTFPEIEMQYYCETGVFMERGSGIERQLYTRDMDYTQRLRQGMAFCNEVSLIPSACMRFILPGFNNVEKSEQFSTACDAMLAGLARRNCYNALGYFSRDYLSRNVGEVARVCGQSQQADRRACVSGVALMKKDHTVKDDIATICAALRDEPMRETCNDQGRRHYYQIGNPVLKEWLS